MADEVAIKIEHVGKDFVLPHEKVTSIKSLFTGLFRWRRVSKEKQHALKAINFEIKKGEFFGIVGRNGSGKSTLLKMLAGIYQPTTGKITTRGKLVPFIELGVGFNPELTGRENVYLNGAMLGFSREEIDKMYESIVKFAEIERFMDQKLKNYSSGMQVRLAFSMAIRAHADVLLIDEVLAVGDANFQRKCYEYFYNLKKSGTTVIFVSHDMTAVQNFCDRAALINESELVDIGSPDVIASQYNKLMVATNPTLSVAGSPRSSKTGPSGEERWGDGQAQILSVKTNKRTYSQEEKEVVISIVMRANGNIEKPIIGFSIKNEKFQQLFGTNTVRMKKMLAPLKSGETVKVEWTVPNIFNEGIKYVDSTVAHDDASMVADRWPDAATFSVFADISTPYLVNPEIDFKVKD